MEDHSHPNRDVVANLYTRYYTDLRQYFVSYTHDMMAAEDMVQNLFVKVMDLDVIVMETAGNILFTMAHNMVIDDVRHKAYVRQAHERLYDRMERQTTAEVRRVEQRDLLQLADRRLGQMSDKRARVFRMFRYDGLSAKEIAQELNINVRTVETDIYLSTKDVKTYLRKIMRAAGTLGRSCSGEGSGPCRRPAAANGERYSC
jgi:RNA polymerase sigma-70 factor (ECF subfamily)